MHRCETELIRCDRAANSPNLLRHTIGPFLSNFYRIFTNAWEQVRKSEGSSQLQCIAILLRMVIFTTDTALPYYYMPKTDRRNDSHHKKTQGTKSLSFIKKTFYPCSLL